MAWLRNFSCQVGLYDFHSWKILLRCDSLMDVSADGIMNHCLFSSEIWQVLQVYKCSSELVIVIYSLQRLECDLSSTLSSTNLYTYIHTVCIWWLSRVVL